MIRTAPGWVVSTGLHVVVLLAATLVGIEMPARSAERPLALTMTTPGGVSPISELPRDIFERKGIPRDELSEPTDEPAISFPEARGMDDPSFN